MNLLRGWPSVRIAAPFISLTNDNICTSPAGGMPLFNIVWLYSHFCVSFFPVVREDSRVFLFFKPTLHLESSVMTRCLAVPSPQGRTGWERARSFPIRFFWPPGIPKSFLHDMAIVPIWPQQWPSPCPSWLPPIHVTMWTEDGMAIGAKSNYP